MKAGLAAVLGAVEWRGNLGRAMVESTIWYLELDREPSIGVEVDDAAGCDVDRWLDAFEAELGWTAVESGPPDDWNLPFPDPAIVAPFRDRWPSR